MNYLQKRLALLVSGLLIFVVPRRGLAFASQADQSTAQPTPPAAKRFAEELQQLVAPIALYPNALVSQIVAAATYPTEIVEADRWVV